jgi:hypothetical protein
MPFSLLPYQGVSSRLHDLTTEGSRSREISEKESAHAKPTCQISTNFRLIPNLLRALRFVTCFKQAPEVNVPNFQTASSYFELNFAPALCAL